MYHSLMKEIPSLQTAITFSTSVSWVVDDSYFHLIRASKQHQLFTHTFNVTLGRTTTQTFRKVPKLPIFVFEHATHMPCSSVTYTALLKSIRQSENISGLIWCNEENDMVHHPFFGNNEQVHMIYKSLLDDDTTTAKEEHSFRAILRNWIKR